MHNMYGDIRKSCHNNIYYLYCAFSMTSILLLQYSYTLQVHKRAHLRFSVCVILAADEITLKLTEDLK